MTRKINVSRVLIAYLVGALSVVPLLGAASGGDAMDYSPLNSLIAVVLILGLILFIIWVRAIFWAASAGQWGWFFALLFFPEIAFVLYLLIRPGRKRYKEVKGMTYVFCPNPNCYHEDVPVGSPQCPYCGNIMYHVCGAAVPYGSPRCPRDGYKFYWPTSLNDAARDGLSRYEQWLKDQRGNL